MRYADCWKYTASRSALVTDIKQMMAVNINPVNWVMIMMMMMAQEKSDIIKVVISSRYCTFSSRQQVVFCVVLFQLSARFFFCRKSLSQIQKTSLYSWKFFFCSWEFCSFFGSSIFLPSFFWRWWSLDTIHLTKPQINQITPPIIDPSHATSQSYCRSPISIYFCREIQWSQGMCVAVY